NHIKYYVGDQKTGNLVKNDFYFDEIKNINYRDATRKIHTKWCGVKQNKIRIIKDANVNKFYLLYKRNSIYEKQVH
ncbi:hypothetical protein, partial [Butyricimonas paravirosa]